jgi:hypothetical protein
MVNRRPTPELIRARKWEIKRRYENHPKVGRRSRGMAAIRIAELMRWFDDEYGAGVEIEPNDRSELIVRIFAHHFMSLPQGPRRLSSWFDRYAPWLSLRDREYLISEATHCPLKWSADKLAWKIGLKDEQRAKLKITTIGAIDCNREQRKQRDRERRAQAERNRRAAKHTPRVPTI